MLPTSRKIVDTILQYDMRHKVWLTFGASVHPPLLQFRALPHQTGINSSELESGSILLAVAPKNRPLQTGNIILRAQLPVILREQTSILSQVSSN